MEAVLAAAVLAALTDAFNPAPVKSLVLAGVVLAAAAAAALWLRGRQPALIAGTAAVALLGAVAYLDRQQERLNDTRYAAESEPVLATIAKADAAPRPTCTSRSRAIGTRPASRRSGPRSASGSTTRSPWSATTPTAS